MTCLKTPVSPKSSEGQPSQRAASAPSCRVVKVDAEAELAAASPIEKIVVIDKRAIIIFFMI